MNTNPLAAAPADVAPAAADRWRDPSVPVAERVCDLLSRMTLEEKLGQLGSAWLSEPEDGTAQLARLQAQVMAQSRFGIPAIAHEECLTGLAAWKATAYPVPLAWGASFDAETVTLMAAAIGASMRAVGIHQGLAPVLDVARDPRWGRVEETISADPYLVGVLGTAYVRGLESSGVIATLKHFAGAGGVLTTPVSVTPLADG